MYPKLSLMTVLIASGMLFSSLPGNGASPVGQDNTLSKDLVAITVQVNYGQSDGYSYYYDPNTGYYYYGDYYYPNQYYYGDYYYPYYYYTPRRYYGHGNNWGSGYHGHDWKGGKQHWKGGGGYHKH